MHLKNLKDVDENLKVFNNSAKIIYDNFKNNLDEVKSK